MNVFAVADGHRMGIGREQLVLVPIYRPAKTCILGYILYLCKLRCLITSFRRLGECVIVVG
jgi:hypothetical protein